MSELRYNPLSQEWVIIAVERATRPESFSMKEIEKAKPKNQCPFCYSFESMTPPEVYAVPVNGKKDRQPNTSNWQMRVVPNKFAALSRDVIPDNGFITLGSCAVTCMAYGYGAHEVIISSPEHTKSIGQLEQKQVELIAETYQKRYRVLSKDKLVEYIQIICNHGKAGGASLEHPHSQAFAMPIVPKLIEREHESFRTYHKREKKCLLCAVSEDAEKRDLVVYENDAFVVFCPFWAKMPFETWIVPKKCAARFEETSEADLKLFAKALRMMLQKMYIKLNNPPYDFYIHTLPVRETRQEKANKEFHWHLECVPRLNTQAGLEYGTEVFINTMVPEKAAEFLR